MLLFRALNSRKSLSTTEWIVIFFDLLVILVVSAVIIFFLYNKSNREENWISVRVLYQNDNPFFEGTPPTIWLVEDIRPGLKSYNSLGQVVAEVEDVNTFDVGGYWRRSYIDIKVKADFDENRKTYIFNAKPLEIGGNFNQGFEGVSVKGLIAYVGEAPVAYAEREIKVWVKGVEPWEVPLYRTGLQMTDTNGEVLAEVIRIEIAPDSWWEFSDIRGRHIKVTHPENKQVYISLKIKTFKNALTEHFIDRTVIKVGSKIWFQFPDLAVEDAEIVEVK